jgi:hypothetical protein
LDHVGITDRPANPRALITSRRDLNSIDDAAAAASRAQALIEQLRKSWAEPAPPAPPVDRHHFKIRHAAPLILGAPAALLKRPRTDFSRLVCQLEERSRCFPN